MVVVWLTRSCDSKMDRKDFSTTLKTHHNQGKRLSARSFRLDEEKTIIPFSFFPRTVSLKPLQKRVNSVRNIFAHAKNMTF